MDLAQLLQQHADTHNDARHEAHLDIYESSEEEGRHGDDKIRLGNLGGGGREGGREEWVVSSRITMPVTNPTNIS